LLELFYLLVNEGPIEIFILEDVFTHGPPKQGLIDGDVLFEGLASRGRNLPPLRKQILRCLRLTQVVLVNIP
jgi:hypothetical protein